LKKYENVQINIGGCDMYESYGELQENVTKVEDK
jgi:hypothetical protein